KARREFQHKEYELLVGDHRFPMPGDASAVVHRLERWFRYHLSDFVPQVKNVYAWKAPAGTKPLPARQTVLCEDCQRLIIPVPGGCSAIATRCAVGDSAPVTPRTRASARVALPSRRSACCRPSD